MATPPPSPLIPTDTADSVASTAILSESGKSTGFYGLTGAQISGVIAAPFTFTAILVVLLVIYRRRRARKEIAKRQKELKEVMPNRPVEIFSGAGPGMTLPESQMQSIDKALPRRPSKAKRKDKGKKGEWKEEALYANPPTNASVASAGPQNPWA